MTKRANSRHIFLLSISTSMKQIRNQISSTQEKIGKRKTKSRYPSHEQQPFASVKHLQTNSHRSSIPRTPRALLSTDRTQTPTNSNGIHQDTCNPTYQGLSIGLPSESTYCLDCGTAREQLGHRADLR